MNHIHAIRFAFFWLTTCLFSSDGPSLAIGDHLYNFVEGYEEN